MNGLAETSSGDLAECCTTALEQTVHGQLLYLSLLHLHRQIDDRSVLFSILYTRPVPLPCALYVGINISNGRINAWYQ